MYSFPNLEPVCRSMSSSNCCFFTCIQILQEGGQVVWYSYLFKNFLQLPKATVVVIHTVKSFGVVNKAVQFSRSVVSDSLQPYGLQHARLPCQSPTPGACSNSCPLHQWCHPTISSSVLPFSSSHQTYPASGTFPMNRLFALGGQSIRVSASASVLQVNIQDWFP